MINIISIVLSVVATVLYARAAVLWGMHKKLLEAQLEDARTNADRYLWLRKQHWSLGVDPLVVTTASNVRLGAMTYSYSRLDAVIDERMSDGPLEEPLDPRRGEEPIVDNE